MYFFLETFAGRNPYCIDKNYGGVLIIWDRIFGKYKFVFTSHSISSYA